MQSIFQQFHACDRRTRKAVVFQKSFQFFLHCCPNLQIFYPFFALFLKNHTHALTFQNRPCRCLKCTSDNFRYCFPLLLCNFSRNFIKGSFLLYFPVFCRGLFIQYVRKIFRKTNISYPLIRTRTCAYQWVRNVSFSENLAYVLNG